MLRWTYSVGPRARERNAILQSSLYVCIFGGRRESVVANGNLEMPTLGAQRARPAGNIDNLPLRDGDLPPCPSVSIYPGLRRRRRHHATRAPPAGTTTSPCRAPTGSGGRHEKAAEPAEGLRAARPALASPASHCVQPAARATAPAALDVLDRWMDRQPAWGFRFPAAARWATCPPQQPHALTAAA